MIQPGGVLLCAAMFDDGSGPALYIGGYHDGLDFALSPSGLARIRDGRLEIIPPIAQGPFNESVVRAMLVHDDGSGPALYLAGAFRFSYQEPEYRGVVRWRNGGWESAGIGLDSAHTLAEFDEDGDGPAPPRLFAGGRFEQGDVRAVARWDGQSWSSVGPYVDVGGVVTDLAVGDDGSGPALYAGGTFGSIGGVASPRIARWNGVEWSSVGGGLPTLQLPTNAVYTLEWHDDGSGPALYAGGRLSVMTADGPTYGMARWDGEQWGSVGVSQGSAVRAAASQTINGLEELLIIVGQLNPNGQVIDEFIARRNGASFEQLPGQPQFRFPVNAALSAKSAALAAHDEGVLVLGRFDTVHDDVVARGVAVWDGRSFKSYIEHLGLADVFDAPALAVDPESGALYLGGNFAAVGGHFRPYLARLDEQGWSSVGQGLDGKVSSLVFHDEGSGLRLFAGGNFTRSGEANLERSVAVFDGVEWSRVATLNTGEALALASIGGDLYAGGTFGSVDGLDARRIARRDGSGWHALGAGLSGGASQVRAIIPWQGGVAVGGSFTDSAGFAMRNIAFWDGKQWTPFGEGLNFTVRALAEYRGELYAGGEFTQSGASPVRYIARWDGAAWRPLGGQLSGPVRAARVFDDGSGPRLYVAGSLGNIGGQPFGGVAAWDGNSWFALDAGVAGGRIDAIAPYAIGGDSAGLFISGVFTSVSGTPSLGIATWRGCLSACPGDANGDQMIDMADLMIVVDAFNTSESDAMFNAAADFDGNGAVDFEDLNRVIAAFNMGC